MADSGDGSAKDGGWLAGDRGGLATRSHEGPRLAGDRVRLSGGRWSELAADGAGLAYGGDHVSGTARVQHEDAP
jgi:hypothetical protein